VTGLPVYSHASWTYSSPGGRYRLRVSFIGERIVWLQPQGYVRLRHAREGMALLADVLLAMLPQEVPLIAVDDYSAVAGASMNARRSIIQYLRQQKRIQAYIVYRPGSLFRRGLDLIRHFGLFPFEVLVCQGYEDALAAAQARLHGKAVGSAPESAAPATAPRKAQGATPLQGDPAAATLAEHATELVDRVGRLILEPYGFAPQARDVPFDHPLRPVFDALAILQDDRQAILQRHRKARDDLQERKKELTGKRALLDETHTTLKILLTARQEERHRLEAKIRDRFSELLFPLMEGLAGTRLTARQRLLIPLVKDLICQIGTLLPWESAASPPAFTARERMIAYLIANGQSTRTIADILGLSRRTIENHCQRMRRKAGLRGRRRRLKDWLMEADHVARAPRRRIP
jgi:DNA-binding CsgD family transcriptional regulator